MNQDLNNNPSYVQGNWQEVSDLIKEADEIYIFHHINPDGDCLGSQFGLKDLIEHNYPNKKVFAVGDSKNILNFLDFKHANLAELKVNPENSLGLLVDVVSGKRVCEYEFFLNSPFKYRARIDHHPNYDETKIDGVWVDAHYAACCEQVIHLAYLNKWKVDLKAAEYLYLGLNTDSGRFNFINVQARTFFLAGWLCDKADFRPFKINYHLSIREENSVRFQAEVLTHFKKENKKCWYIVTQEIMEKFNLSIDTANNVNILSNIDDSLVWLFFIEDSETEYRVRLRSNGILVNKIAEQFNGGGHNMASGARIQKNQVQEVLNAIDLAISEYEKNNK